MNVLGCAIVVLAGCGGESNTSSDNAALTMPTCGTTLTSFNGTAAYSNGSDTGPSGLSCGGGNHWQCVELVMRYFGTHFGISWSGNANELLTNAPRDSVDVYDNGDTANPPVPGDLVVWLGGGYGHTALVTSVTATSVTVMEQNVVGNGTATLSFSAGRISNRWSGYTTSGWAHAKSNGVPGVPDCVNRSGWNCGDDGVINGNANTNYDCKLGQSTPLAEVVCPYGCKIMPNGVADVCNAAPAPDCSHRSGWNCGNDGVINGNADTNYYCNYGQVAPVEAVVCTYGCVVMPNGTADHCQAK